MTIDYPYSSVTRSTGFRADKIEAPQVPADLARLRQSIDNIDAALVHLLAERFGRTQEVGRLKAEFGLPPVDPERERRQVDRLRRIAVEARLDPLFAETFLDLVIAEVIRHHEAILREIGPS